MGSPAGRCVGGAPGGSSQMGRPGGGPGRPGGGPGRPGGGPGTAAGPGRPGGLCGGGMRGPSSAAGNGGGGGGPSSSFGGGPAGGRGLWIGSSGANGTTSPDGITRPRTTRKASAGGGPGGGATPGGGAAMAGEPGGGAATPGEPRGGGFMPGDPGGGPGEPGGGPGGGLSRRMRFKCLTTQIPMAALEPRPDDVPDPEDVPGPEDASGEALDPHPDDVPDPEDPEDPEDDALLAAAAAEGTIDVDDSHSDTDGEEEHDHHQEHSQHQELLHTFRPLVVFDSQEEHFPCSAEWFCAHGVLERTRDAKSKRPKKTWAWEPLAAAPAPEDLPADDEPGTRVRVRPTDRAGDRAGTEAGEVPFYGFARQCDGYVELKYCFLYTYNGNVSPMPQRVLGVPIQAVVSGLHDGDLEHITVRVDPAGQGTVLEVFFAAHASEGQWRRPAELSWHPAAEGRRVCVFAARNGHASYPAAGRQRRSVGKTPLQRAATRRLGVADDACDGRGVRWDAARVVDLFGDAPPRWLAFKGFWGDIHNIPRNWWFRNAGEEERRVRPGGHSMVQAVREPAGRQALVAAGGQALVGDVRCAAGLRRCRAAALAVGAAVHTDRPYRLTEAGPWLPSHGAAAVLTACDDKGSRGARFLTFTVAQACSVFVLYDRRADSAPGWLTAEFSLEAGLSARAASNSYAVYRRSAGAGEEVALGGNEGAKTMYAVAVVPLAAAAAGGGEFVLSDVRCAGSRRKYKAARMSNGDRLYTDRDYKLKGLPAALTGLSGVRTACDDKAADFRLRFSVSAPAVVTVLYDKRFRERLPAWLAAGFDFVPGVEVAVRPGITFVALQREVPAGEVELGGCAAKTGYAVLVCPL